VRIRKVLAEDPAIAEKRMFGGVAFLVHGNMSVGVYGDRLIVRTTPDRAAQALATEGIEPFDLTGRPMRGWLFVTDLALPDARALARWVHEGVAFARTLPPK
jgi:TfoX/Sxy family transcriptional regulator of competence genes